MSPRKMTTAVVATLVLALGAGSPQAAENQPLWSTPLALGPSDVTSIAARPGLVVAAGRPHMKNAFPSGQREVPGPRVAGIFTSTDLGRTWTRGRERIVHPNGEEELRTISETPSLVAAPQTGSEVYAILGSKVWRSDDHGDKWRPVGDVGGAPSTLDVLSDGRVVAGLAAGGLRSSSDRGQTWSTLGSGLPASRVNQLHPHSATVMLVATDSGLYRSGDGGSTFTQVTSGIASPSTQALGVSGFGTSALFLAMPGQIATQTLVYTSTDGGSSWQPRVSPAGQNLLPRVNPGAFEVVVQSSLYVIVAGTNGGVYRSGRRTQAGIEWERVDPEPGTSHVGALTFVDTNPSTISDHTVFASLRRGSPAAISATDSRLVAPGWIDEMEGGRICGGLVLRSDRKLFAACGRHVFSSTDDGANWERASNGLPYLTVGIGDTPYMPLVQGADGSLWTSGFHYGLYHSNANVTEWSKVPIPAASVGAIGTHPTDPNTVFAAGLLTNGSTGVLWKTTDGGTTWRPSPDLGTAIYNISVNRATPSKVLVAAYSRGVYLSENGGDTWANAGGILGNVYRVLYARSDPSRAWALTSEGLFRSDDGGRTFTFVGELFIDGRETTSFEMEISPWDANTVYILPTTGEVAVSRDGGGQWELIDSGLPKDPECGICEDVQNLVLDPANPGRMYISAGIMGNGAEPHSYWVYRADDPQA